MVGFCDYRGNSKKRHGQFQEAEEKKLGFRLWSSGPNFDTDLPQDVSGVVGQTAYLTCRVFDRTNKTVRIKIINKNKHFSKYSIYCCIIVFFWTEKNLKEEQQKKRRLICAKLRQACLSNMLPFVN